MISICIHKRQTDYISFDILNTLNPINIGLREDGFRELYTCTSSISEISFQATTHLSYCANVEKGSIWTLSWVKGIQVYSFEGPSPFPREYNNQLEKIHSFDKIWKFSTAELLGQFQPNLSQSICGWREFMLDHIKGPVLFQMEIIKK